MKIEKIDGREYPSAIVLLSRTFEVKWHEGKVPCKEADELVQGWCDTDGQTLHINRLLANSAVAEVLLHELNHAINWMWENEHIKREEEDQTNQLSITLITVARQNPGFLTWLDVMSAI